MGLVDSKWRISPRDQGAPPWGGEAANRDWEDLRMAVYAAQIDRMDQRIGRILAQIEANGQSENTLVMFLADNGGCAEFLMEDTNAPEPSRYSAPTVDGRPMRIGNDPGITPGPDDTFMSYDLPWANASNAPFRLYKSWVHEGGISTPFVVHWPSKIDRPGIVHEPAHVIDITATCLDAAGAAYPSELNGNPITPLEGESLMPAIRGGRWARQQPIFWEYEGNRAVRMGRWKLVSEYPGAWELYDIDEDRTELNDLAARSRDRVADMVRLSDEWAARCGVLASMAPRTTSRNRRSPHAHMARLGPAQPPRR